MNQRAEAFNDYPGCLCMLAHGSPQPLARQTWCDLFVLCHRCDCLGLGGVHLFVATAICCTALTRPGNWAKGERLSIVPCPMSASSRSWIADWHLESVLTIAFSRPPLPFTQVCSSWLECSMSGLWSPRWHTLTLSRMRPCSNQRCSGYAMASCKRFLNLWCQAGSPYWRLFCSQQWTVRDLRV